MPPLSAAPQRTGTQLSAQFRDFRGKPKSMTGIISAAATAAEAAAIVTAAGNMSNARVLERRITTFVVQIADSNPLNTAYDEAYSTVDDELVVVFQATATGEIREFRIPAPDASLFQPDGETVLVADSGAAAGSGALLLDTFYSATLTGLGAGFVWARSYKNRTTRRAPTPLPISEPTGLPGDAPGL